METSQCFTLGSMNCSYNSCHVPRDVREYTYRPCHRRTRKTYVNRVLSLRLQARRLLGPAPVDNLILSSEDLEDTDLDALFSVLSNRCPKDPVRTLSLESHEIAIDGLNLISQYLAGNQVLEWLSLADAMPVDEVSSQSRNDMKAFVAAISRSRINSLSLALNDTLRCQFLSSFRFYCPPSRFLRSINLSGIDNTIDELSISSAALHLLTLSRVLMVRTSYRYSPSIPSPYWQSLPVELQLQILQYIFASLSFTRIARIVNYAADLSTLPRAGNREGRTMEHWLDMVGCGSG